jgi:hypothetical protein
MSDTTKLATTTARPPTKGETMKDKSPLQEPERLILVTKVLEAASRYVHEREGKAAWVEKAQRLMSDQDFKEQRRYKGERLNELYAKLHRAIEVLGNQVLTDHLAARGEADFKRWQRSFPNYTNRQGPNYQGAA